ncbi:hypothetical protein BDE36_1332 [Arcticibacter tournemirensis]|nr:hypothetical protein BDE36_1332 [Arcticibacter tournemirensis]
MVNNRHLRVSNYLMMSEVTVAKEPKYIWECNMNCHWRPVQIECGKLPTISFSSIVYLEESNKT